MFPTPGRVSHVPPASKEEEEAELAPSNYVLRSGFDSLIYWRLSWALLAGEKLRLHKHFSGLGLDECGRFCVLLVVS